MCQFKIAWVGQCQDPQEEYCEEHLLCKCVVCNRQATHACEETCGLVCGASLCDKCIHQLNSQGVNDGLKHCSKSEQKHLSWIEQDFCRDNISQEDWMKMTEQQKLDAIRTPPTAKPPKEIWEYARQVCDKLGVNAVWSVTYFQTVHDCWFRQIDIEECCNALLMLHNHQVAPIKYIKCALIITKDDLSRCQYSVKDCKRIPKHGACNIENFKDFVFGFTNPQPAYIKVKVSRDSECNYFSSVVLPDDIEIEVRQDALFSKESVIDEYT